MEIDGEERAIYTKKNTFYSLTILNRKYNFEAEIQMVSTLNIVTEAELITRH